MTSEDNIMFDAMVSRIALPRGRRARHVYQSLFGNSGDPKALLKTSTL